MKDEYILYLDESEAKKSKTFAIAGIAIKKENVQILEDGIKEIKNIIWSDEYLALNKPILHCTELERVYANRNSDNAKGIKTQYLELKKMSPEEIQKIYMQVYGKMAQILKKADATVFSCIIEMKQLHDLFFLDENHNGNHLIDDKYNIALQKVIENFTHYLSVNDGYGNVIYESRNNIGENSANSPDIKLTNVYHKIQANNKGIVYTNSSAIQNRNRTIVTYPKTENIAGLQFADFVANNIIKLAKCNVKKQITDFMKLIHKISYNGGHSISEVDQRSFWGMRILPSYLRMENLILENKTLKNSYANIKKERNKQNKVIKAKDKKIAELEEKLQILKNKNQQLSNIAKYIDFEEDK